MNGFPFVRGDGETSIFVSWFLAPRYVNGCIHLSSLQEDGYPLCIQAGHSFVDAFVNARVRAGSITGLRWSGWAHDTSVGDDGYLVPIERLCFGCRDSYLEMTGLFRSIDDDSGQLTSTVDPA